MFSWAILFYSSLLAISLAWASWHYLINSSLQRCVSIWSLRFSSWKRDYFKFCWKSHSFLYWAFICFFSSSDPISWMRLCSWITWRTSHPIKSYLHALLPLLHALLLVLGFLVLQVEWGGKDTYLEREVLVDCASGLAKHNAWSIVKPSFLLHWISSKYLLLNKINQSLTPVVTDSISPN